MENLRTIIRELKNILSQEGLTDLEQKDVLEMSVKIYLTDKINNLGISNYQIDKKVNPDPSGEEIGHKEIDKVELASDKQIVLLKQLKKFKEGISKQEAWKIISESKKRKEKNQDY